MGKCFSTHHADEENEYNDDADDAKTAARSSAGVAYKTSPAWSSSKLAQKRTEFWGVSLPFSFVPTMKSAEIHHLLSRCATIAIHSNLCLNAH